MNGGIASLTIPSLYFKETGDAEIGKRLYDVVTLIVGGAISGYCSTGKDTRPITPANIIVIDITVERTGRSINVFKFINYSLIG